jgi:hypothetical protein
MKPDVAGSGWVPLVVGYVWDGGRPVWARSAWLKIGSGAPARHCEIRLESHRWRQPGPHRVSPDGTNQRHARCGMSQCDG